jgi:hypothetical protein
MREFNNKIEREFLEILNEMDKNIEVNLSSYLSQCILKNDRLIQLDDKKVTLIYNIKKESELSFIKDLSIVISLIEVLKDERLIFTHINPEILNSTLNKYATQPTPDHIKNKGWEGVTGLTNDKNLESKIQQNSSSYGKCVLPTTLSNYIIEYVDQFCYVRPELTEYIKNKFNTPEQLRFKTTLFWTQIATIIAFIGLLIAISLPILTKTKHVKESISNLNQETNKVIQDSLINFQEDTLNVQDKIKK